MKHKSRLAIIDWGIGGISIYKLVKAELRPVPVVYLSDTGVTPYGRMSPPELVNRVNGVIEFLSSQRVTHLAIGCNAASTVIPLLNPAGMKIVGTIEGAVRSAAMLRPRALAVIGGKRTVLSGVYRREFAKRGIKATQRIAQPLSALIESGDVSSPDLERKCKAILSPIRASSHILLACTHYPAILPVLRQFVSAQTVFVDPAAEVVNTIREWNLPAGGADMFLTTGDPEQMKIAARKAFGVRIRTIGKVAI